MNDKFKKNFILFSCLVASTVGVWFGLLGIAMHATYYLEMEISEMIALSSIIIGIAINLILFYFKRTRIYSFILLLLLYLFILQYIFFTVGITNVLESHLMIFLIILVGLAISIFALFYLKSKPNKSLEKPLDIF